MCTCIIRAGNFASQLFLRSYWQKEKSVSPHPPSLSLLVPPPSPVPAEQRQLFFVCFMLRLSLKSECVFFFLLLFFTDACGRDRSTANVCVYGQQICRERNNPKENIKLCAHQVSVWSMFLQIFSIEAAEAAVFVKALYPAPFLVQNTPPFCSAALRAWAEKYLTKKHCTFAVKRIRCSQRSKHFILEMSQCIFAREKKVSRKQQGFGLRERASWPT